MAYTKTTWLDRVVQFPYRYTKSGESTSEVTLIRSPGTVTEAGTPVNAGNLNKIENGIESAHNKFLIVSDIEGTTQFPTYTNGDITKVEHKLTSDLVTIVRTDTFTYTSTLITEVRTLNTGESITFKYYFDSSGVYQKTEVI